jgi:hypothetical protein
VPLAVVRLLGRTRRAQVRLIESTMIQLMPQLARGELDVVVGRSDQEYGDPQLQTARSIPSRSTSSHGPITR